MDESVDPRTQFEVRTERELGEARAAGDERKVSDLQALLATQGELRKRGETLCGTLTSIEHEVLRRYWKVDERRAEARMAGLFWGLLWVAAFWMFWASGLNELGHFFSKSLGLPSGLTLVLTLTTWIGTLALLFQRGCFGTTVAHVVVAWYRKRLGS